MNVNPSTVPDHFELMPPFGPSHEMVGPIYVKGPDGGWIVGMRVEQRHHNKGRRNASPAPAPYFK